MSIIVIEFEKRFSKKRNRLEDWVCYGPADSFDKSRTWARVDSMKPPKADELDDHRREMKYAHMEHVWSLIEPAYKAWLEGVDMPKNGTPLVTWAAMTKAHISELRKIKIHTIEDLSKASEGRMRKVQLPDSINLPGLAKTYLESKDKSDLAERTNRQEREIADLRSKLDEVMSTRSKEKA